MHTDLPASSDYSHILLQSSGLLDVRAPLEFSQGALPNAVNHPLLNDQERRQVGIHYKTHGQSQAVQLGHKLVSGDIKQQRIQTWIDFAKRHKQAYLYCLRGGLRSKISQQWLHAAGVDITRVQGGYKSLRRHLIKTLEQAGENFNFILIGGLTGCRKTILIQALENGIDLEAAACHRGSSFGAHARPQHSQINFENQLAIDLLTAKKSHQVLIAMEDESRFIGSVNIPKNIFSKMRISPLVVIEQNFAERARQLLKEYIINMEKEFNSLYQDPDAAFTAFSDYLISSLNRIQKRLGTGRWQVLSKIMQQALQSHKHSRNTGAHLDWITLLLKDYYDPMYHAQLEKRRQYIIFRGHYDDCYQFLTGMI